MTTMTCPAPRVKPSKPARALEARLSLEINGSTYALSPIRGIEDPAIQQAWRLEKHGDPDATYDVARECVGLVTCTCPDYEARHRGNGFSTCKHGQSLVALGLLRAPAGEPAPTGATPFNRIRHDVTDAVPETVPMGTVPEPATPGVIPQIPHGPVRTCPASGKPLRWTGTSWTTAPEPAASNVANLPHSSPAPCCAPEAVPCVACAEKTSHDATFSAAAPEGIHNPETLAADGPASDAPDEPAIPEWAKPFHPTVIDDAALDDPAEWPIWTDADVWAPSDITTDDGGPGDDGSRLDLEGWIRTQADRYRRMGHAAGDLVARVLAELADEVVLVKAKDVPTYRDRIVCLSLDPAL